MSSIKPMVFYLPKMLRIQNLLLYQTEILGVNEAIRQIITSRILDVLKIRSDTSKRYVKRRVLA